MKSPALWLLGLLLLSCSTKEYEAIPKPYAFPRIEIPQASYDTTACGEVIFAVNAHAQIQATESSTNINLLYPNFGATVYISSLRAANTKALAEAEANRHQRISLNLGGKRCTSEEFVNDANYRCELISTSEVAVIPLQFLAVRPDGLIVNGAVVLSHTPTNADSIAPVVEALYADMFHLLSSLQ